MADLVPLSVAIRDPRLLGATVPWSPRQLTIQDALGGPERRHILELGRQSGKDEMLAAFACHNAALRADLDVVLPQGTVRDILACCPRKDQGEEFVATCAKHLDAAPLLRRYAEVLGDRITFELPRADADGRPFTAKVRILALPANSRTVRGFRASAVIYNEMGFLDEAGGPGSAEGLWRALLPSLRAFGAAGRVICSSTPNGTTGKFAELVQQAQNGWAGTVYHHAATWDVVPVNEQEIEEWRSELGESWFLQEYGAEQINAGGAFFDLTGVAYLPGPTPPGEGTEWICGLDPATVRDRFACCVVGRSRDDPETLVLGPCGSIPMERAGLVSAQAEASGFLAACEEIWAAVEPYLPHGLRVVSDTAKAQAVQSFFGRRGAEVEVVSLKGEQMKAAYISTKTRIQDGSLRLYEEPNLMEDLRLVQMRDGGQIHLPRVRSRHADTASALVAAVQLHREQEYGAAAAAPVEAAAYAASNPYYLGNSIYGA